VKARVIIYPRDEVLDPQGKAVAKALGRLGFDGVTEVRVGKILDIALKVKSKKEAMRKLEAMCQKLLANQVMEEYEIEVGGR